MTADDIERLSLAARRAGLEQLELTLDGCSLRLRLATDELEAVFATTIPTRTERRWVKAPGVGRFHHGHPVTGQPITTPGQRVEAGQIVGLLQIGSCLRPVMASHVGVIGPAVAEDGALVGYGAILYPLD